MNLVKRIRKSLDEEALKDQEEYLKEMETSLTLGPPIIQGQYDHDFRRFGDAYEHGDQLARETLKDIIIILQTTLLTDLRMSLLDEAQPDYTKLQQISDDSRVNTVVCLGQLYQRIGGSAPMSAIPSPNLSASKTSSGHSFLQLYGQPMGTPPRLSYASHSTAGSYVQPATPGPVLDDHISHLSIASSRARSGLSDRQASLASTDSHTNSLMARMFAGRPELQKPIFDPQQSQMREPSPSIGEESDIDPEMYSAFKKTNLLEPVQAAPPQSRSASRASSYRNAMVSQEPSLHEEPADAYLDNYGYIPALLPAGGIGLYGNSYPAGLPTHSGVPVSPPPRSPYRNMSMSQRELTFSNLNANARTPFQPQPVNMPNAPWGDYQPSVGNASPRVMSPTFGMAEMPQVHSLAAQRRTHDSFPPPPSGPPMSSLPEPPTQLQAPMRNPARASEPMQQRRYPSNSANYAAAMRQHNVDRASVNTASSSHSAPPIIAPPTVHSTNLSLQRTRTRDSTAPSMTGLSSPTSSAIAAQNNPNATLHQTLSLKGTNLPSPENNYAAFCKGAWKIQLSLKKAFTPEHRPAGMYGSIPFWRCGKCCFEGPMNAAGVEKKKDRDYDRRGRCLDEKLGIRYRWSLLAKSHTYLKGVPLDRSGRGEEGAFGCLFCCAVGVNVETEAPLTGGAAPVFGNIRTFMDHLAVHRGLLASGATNTCDAGERLRVISDRIAGDSEDWDINFLPVPESEKHAATVDATVLDERPEVVEGVSLSVDLSSEYLDNESNHDSLFESFADYPSSQTPLSPSWTPSTISNPYELVDQYGNLVDANSHPDAIAQAKAKREYHQFVSTTRAPSRAGAGGTAANRGGRIFPSQLNSSRAIAGPTPWN